MRKLIKGFESYSIDEDGVVIREAGGNGARPGRVLRTFRDPEGYLRVNLSVNNTNRPQLVHRLLLETFGTPCPPGYDCRHLNGDPTDNRLENLKWGTRAENCEDARRHGRTLTGEKNSQSRLTEADVLAIRFLFGVWSYSNRELAKLFGVSRTTIRNVREGVSWACVG